GPGWFRDDERSRVKPVIGASIGGRHVPIGDPIGQSVGERSNKRIVGAGKHGERPARMPGKYAAQGPSAEDLRKDSVLEVLAPAAKWKRVDRPYYEPMAIVEVAEAALLANIAGILKKAV